MSISLLVPGGPHQESSLPGGVFWGSRFSPSAVVAPGVETDKTATNTFHRSGQLNAKQRELEELQARAQRRLKGARANLAEGLEAARETRRDLDYTQKKMV